MDRETATPIRLLDEEKNVELVLFVSETLEYLNPNESEDNEDIEHRRLGTSRMLLAQESADLQKAIELSYYDMRATNEHQGKHWVFFPQICQN